MRFLLALAFAWTLTSLASPTIHGQTLPGLPTLPALPGAVNAPSGTTASNVVYVQTNDPRPGLNSILGFRKLPTGQLLPLIGSPFLTRGTGFANPDQLLGPNDEDQSLIASPDRRFLFAVNSGSNTIAVFRIEPNGRLTHVPGSPFPSNGIQPVSLTLTGDKLYVVNMNQDPGQRPNPFLPNYTGFRVNPIGRLNPIPFSTVPSPAGASPTQVLHSPDGKFLFALNLNIDFVAVPPSLFPTQFRSFRILPNGRLAEAPNSPLVVPPEATPPPQLPLPPAALGMQIHPTQPILYTGFVGSNRLAVYGYHQATGALTFVRSVPNSGIAICWLVINQRGTRLFSTNTADASVSSFDLSNPLHPQEIGTLILKDRGPAAPPGLPNLFSSGPFQFALDPSENFLYIVSHRVTTDPTVLTGNDLHILRVQPGGTLLEMSFSPIPLPIPPFARPEGIVVF